MLEIQYSHVISMDDFQDFAVSTRRHDDGPVSDWDLMFAELVDGEGEEFLFQHGNGPALLMPEAFGVNTESEEAEELKDKMADELSDILWFNFTIASHLQESAKDLAAAALAIHTGKEPPRIETFSDLQNEVLANAANIRVLNKMGIFLPDAPDDIRYTSLAQNPYLVLTRTQRRLTRALDKGVRDLTPPTAAEMESITDVKIAVGDLMLVLPYIAKTRLGWNVEDIARYNAHKLTHRQRFGKAVPTP